MNIDIHSNQSLPEVSVPTREAKTSLLSIFLQSVVVDEDMSDSDRDLVGLAINPMIKLLAIVALLIASFLG